MADGTFFFLEMLMNRHASSNLYLLCLRFNKQQEYNFFSNDLFFLFKDETFYTYLGVFFESMVIFKVWFYKNTRRKLDTSQF